MKRIFYRAFLILLLLSVFRVVRPVIMSFLFGTVASTSTTEKPILSRERVKSLKQSNEPEIKARAAVVKPLSVTKGSDYVSPEDPKFIVNVKNISMESAEYIDKSLREGMPFVIRVDSRSNIKKLKKLTGRVNEYGVQFRYDKSAKANGYLYCLISKYDCELYSVAIKLFSKMRKFYLDYYDRNYYQHEKVDDHYFLDYYSYTRDEKAIHVFKNAGTKYGYECMTYWSDYQGGYQYYDSSEEDFKFISAEDVEQELYRIDTEKSEGIIKKGMKKKYDFYLKVKNTPFWNLSTAAKSRIIAACMYCDTSKKKNGNPFIRYRLSTASRKNYKKYNLSGSDLTLLKRLNAGTAKAVCAGYANYEKAIYRVLLGCKTYYASSKEAKHAICVVRTKNSRGRVLYEFQNYDDLLSSSGTVVTSGKNLKARSYTIKCSKKLQAKIRKCKWKQTELE